MILGKTLLEIFKESYTMQLLLIVSIVALAIIIERAIFYIRHRFNYFKELRIMESSFNKMRLEELKRMAVRKNSPFHNLLRQGLENLQMEEQELRELLNSMVFEERAKFEKFLGGLSTIVAIAPLLGLYGTVVGLIKAFHNIAVTGSGGPEVVGAGIAEALLTTAFGLMIAIPSLVFYNYFVKKTEDTTEYLDALVHKILYYRDKYWQEKLKR